jgi:tRNA dimethylallyltransferase
METNKKMKRNKVFIILGPTSSGKTSLALELCQRFNGEIISADSRQIYKNMDIGTGKLPVGKDARLEKLGTNWILNGVKIWGYDVTTLDKFFSGYDFSLFALEKAKEILKSGKNVFLVGGTGFYIDIFTGRVKPSKVKPDLELRESLNLMSLEGLQEKLCSLSMKVFEKTDKNNKVRLIRALEREVSKEINEVEIPYLKNCDFVYIGLNAPREVLYKRADLLVEEVFKAGVVDEVKRLIDLGHGKSPKLQGLIYKSVVQFIDGKLSKEDAIQQAKYDIHQYIKRQLTYFRKNEDIFWVDISKDDYKKIIYNKIEKELRNE